MKLANTTVMTCFGILFTLFMALEAGGQQLSDGTACFKELVIPQYPLLARQGRRTATVEATITIENNKARFSVPEPRLLFGRAVMEALNSSAIAPSCRSGTTLRFVFELDLTKTLESDPGRVIFRPPFTFVIRSAASPVTGN